MGKLNLIADEATLLKSYQISSLAPTRWEEVDHDLETSVAGAFAGSSASAEGDPLGLGSSIDPRNMALETSQHLPSHCYTSLAQARDAFFFPGASILISSKSFDPKAFLSIMHPDATYQDLVAGIAHLRSALDSRSEAIRSLVEENFDRFVAVKSSTDGK
jgi:exocyst complex component 2